MLNLGKLGTESYLQAICDRQKGEVRESPSALALEKKKKDRQYRRQNVRNTSFSPCFGLNPGTAEGCVTET